MKSEHRKKMIAPIVITILMLAYYIFYFSLVMYVIDLRWRILLGIIPLALGGTSIYVCIERIREIRSGEEDDLSKY